MTAEQKKKEEERDKDMAHLKTQLELITKHLTTLNTQKAHAVNARDKGTMYDDYYLEANEEANFENYQGDFWSNTQESNQDSWRQGQGNQGQNYYGNNVYDRDGPRDQGAATCRLISRSKPHDVQQHWRVASKPRKGKGVASSSHGSKRSRRDNKEEHDDERVCLIYALMIGMPINVWEIIEDVLRRAMVKKGHRVEPGLEEPLDDDVATNEEMVRVDSYIESDDDEEDSEMGEAAFAPTNDED
ncbi:hypothetical protein HAX54_022235 [Datura stramonium]|uniref:Uncharacterized protein n=1 Tax=Datura stramonium TaxID=4076 RepID=A0ABS8UUR8_DATST|nr:hypothetical protein [Datura stramonium]